MLVVKFDLMTHFCSGIIPTTVGRSVKSLIIIDVHVGNNISQECFINNYIYELPYSWKYWRELNLAVEPKIAIARILYIYSRFKFGSSVQDRHTYICE